MAIYIHDEAARLRLRVTGDLDEKAAKELASCWTTASSVIRERKIVVDLTSLAAIHDGGRELLAALHHDGAEFLAQPSGFQAQLIAGITGKQVVGEESATGRGVGRWLKGVCGVARA